MTATEFTGSPGTPIHAYLTENRDKLRTVLAEQGAILLRGFEVGGVDGFDRVVRVLSGSAPLTYAERSSPRSTIKGQVYTSTDYPQGEEIFLHNENSYQAVWPRTLYFFCIEPAHTLGATPLADIREVYRHIDPGVREEFERRGWRVVRNFHAEFGVQWQDAFGTDERDAVEEYCRGKGIEPHWRPDGGLRTTAVRRAVHTHPETGSRVWFNHATFFHVSSLAPEVQEGLREIFAEEDLPTNTYYGDGGRIPDEVMDHLRAAYRAASTRFDWQRDDVLVVDNMLAAHGREPFTGPRKIAVAMAEPWDG
ncbi:TauD/TfdA family dioxygenase [Streptomyces spiramyceticus]|uniref:TauD/TfdA family dioxygenase n=1 Tax=Streptomyces spiramyceticus TaxID=299717 RepID=UPI00237B4855|nr:TauD/TfdA family dioxygenase [Streptomyces spiramyceticus]